MLEPPTDSAQPATGSMAYAAAEDLAGVRGFVRAHAVGMGLPDVRADMLVLAVSELATNTLQHTHAGGTVRVWAGAGQVVCDVLDTGPTRSFGAMPPADSIRGRGLAIVERIVDQVAVTTTAEGTLVRIRMDL